MMEATIFTITKGNYKFGVIALINSLRALGLTNKVIVGTAEDIKELENVPNVVQAKIDPEWNPTNLKCKLIIDNPSELFIFFDADIIITEKKFIEKVQELTSNGLFYAAVDGIVPQNDYRRIVWREINPGNSENIEHPWYYNAGFFAGNLKNHLSILERWHELICTHIKPAEFTFQNKKFPMVDQDMYNAVLQNVKMNEIVSISAPDWIGIAAQVNPFFQIGNFRPSAFIHCTGEHKPWKIDGIPRQSPNEYDKLWYEYIFGENNLIKADVKFSRIQHMWFNHSIATRIIRKIKSRF
ncbi:MAG: hypothetical protein EOO90_05990 [Pedobacter sp.]|nr:MAG: hypothetical protein EOO90_05990 [Pedobacter sp.]